MENLIFRTLNENDHNKDYFLLLNQLSNSNNLNQNNFKEIFYNIQKTSEIYIYEDITTNKIVASATLMIEQKFIRNGGKVGHLEDVVVDEKYRGLKLGKKLIEHIIDLAKIKGCYKIIGNCDPNLFNYYQKIGFSNKGNQIAIYF